MGNQGTFSKNFEQMITDAELLYHFAYVIFCILGLCMHPFFYSVLVSSLIINNELNYFKKYFLMLLKLFLFYGQNYKKN